MVRFLRSLAGVCFVRRGGSPHPASAVRGCRRADRPAAASVGEHRVCQSVVRLGSPTRCRARTCASYAGGRARPRSWGSPYS